MRSSHKIKPYHRQVFHFTGFSCEIKWIFIAFLWFLLVTVFHRIFMWNCFTWFSCEIVSHDFHSFFTCGILRFSSMKLWLYFTGFSCEIVSHDFMWNYFHRIFTAFSHRFSSKKIWLYFTGFSCEIISHDLGEISQYVKVCRFTGYSISQTCETESYIYVKSMWNTCEIHVKRL